MSNNNFQVRSRRRRVNGLLVAAVMCAAQAAGSTRLFAADDPATQPATPATQPATDGPVTNVGESENKPTHVALKVNQTRIITTASPILNVVGPDQDVVWVGKPDKSGNSISLAARKPGSVQLEIIDIFHHSQTLEIVVQPDLQSLQAEIDQIAPGHHVIVGSANGTIVLHGHVPSADLADKLVQMAAPFGPRVINMLEISGGQQVTLQVRFAEVSKDAVSALGVNFGIAGNSGFGANIIGGVGPLGISSTAGGAPSLAVGTPGANVTAFAQLTAGKTPFDIFVNALRDNNLLRVLAEPNLTVMSGNQASFLAGGEFPYPVPQSGGAGGGSTTITIDYKQYGVRLLFTPVVLGDGRIRLHVQPEVSDLDYTHSLTLEGFVIPALTTRTADTVVELSEGQTLSMAGLLNNRVNATSTVTPLLGDLPILGALFRSVRYERQETELVVLVTPLLAGPMDPAQVPPVPGEQWRYPSEGQLFLKNDLGGPMADAAHAPKPTAPRQFQGTYGFTPATTPGVANGK